MHREQGAFGLVRIKWHHEQLLERRVGCAAWKQMVQRRCTPCRIALPRKVVKRIVVGAQFMADLGRSS